MVTGALPGYSAIGQVLGRGVIRDPHCAIGQVLGRGGVRERKPASLSLSVACKEASRLQVLCNTLACNTPPARWRWVTTCVDSVALTLTLALTRPGGGGRP